MFIKKRILILLLSCIILFGITGCKNKEKDIKIRDREAMYLNGKYHDVIHMDILESEFTGDYIKNKNVK